MRVSLPLVVILFCGMCLSQGNSGPDKDNKDASAQSGISAQKPEQKSPKSPAVGSPETQRGGSGKQENGQQPSENRIYRVDVVSEPTNSWTKAYVFITGAIGLAGLFSIWVLWRQTNIAQRSADAAFMSARAVINAERAWLDIDLIPVLPAESGIYHLRASNHGKTPGFVTEWLLGRGYWDKDVGDIPVGFAGTVTPEKLPIYNIIPANTMSPINIFRFDVANYPAGEDGQFVTYHGQLSYKDIFKQEHRTEIVYRFHPASRFLEPLPKYTRYVTKTEHGEETD